MILRKFLTVAVLLFVPTLALGQSADMVYADKLLDATKATATAKASGRWSDPAMWGGTVPVAGDKVWLPAGVTVTFDAVTPKLAWFRIDGTFQIKTDAQSVLWAETVVSSTGSSVILGTDTAPVAGSFLMKFADFGPLNPTTDPLMMSRGFICMGSLMGCGAPTTAWADVQPAAKGDTSITLLADPTGWAVGDPIVIGGRSPVTLQNEERAVTAIAGKVISFATPLAFDHASPADNPSFVLNRKTRAVEFTSETPGPTTGGHVMVMTMTAAAGQPSMVNICHFGFRGLGRTDKSKPVTDPDGLGGGTGNPRGRYAGLHMHKNGPAGTPASVVGCYSEGGSSWNFVNHDSNVNYDDCAVYNPGTAAFVTEIGTENGRFLRCAALGTFRGQITSEDEAFGNSDFSHNQQFAWHQGGQVANTDCRAAGFASPAVSVMGISFLNGFKAGNPSVGFPVANLLTPATNPAWTAVGPGAVPQRISGLKVSACNSALSLWRINDNPAFDQSPAYHAMYPEFRIEIPALQVGYSNVTDCVFEVAGVGVARTYMSQCKYMNVKVVRSPGVAITAEGYGFVHSGFTSGEVFDHVTVDGFQYGIETSTSLECNIISPVLSNCAVGIDIFNQSQRIGRRITITGATFTNCATNIKMKVDAPGTDLYPQVSSSAPDDSDFFAGFFQNYNTFCGRDIVTLDGKYLYYPEQGDGFALNQSKNCYTMLAGKTNGQAWTDSKVCLGARRIPADVQSLAGSLALVSDNAPIVLPKIYTADSSTEWGTAVQYTNVQTGFKLWVKGSDQVFRSFGPFNLQLGINICPVNLDGLDRGVFVRCWPAATDMTPYKWGNMWQNPPDANPPPPPPPPPVVPPASADGTRITAPTTATVSDGTAVWSFGAGGQPGGFQILRNGVSAAGGSANLLGIKGGSIFVQNNVATWFKWNGSGWDVIAADPFGGTPPPPPPAPTVTLTASPISIVAGQTATLTWTSTNATSVTITGQTSPPLNGSASVTPTSSTVYTITATGAGGTATATATVTVTPPPPVPLMTETKYRMVTNADGTVTFKLP